MVLGAASADTGAGAAPDSLAIAASHNRLGTGAWEAGDYDRAREELETSLRLLDRSGPGDRAEAAVALRALAALESEQGDLARAVELGRRALAIAERVHGEAHPFTAGVLRELGSALGDLGETREAEELHKRAVGILEPLGADAAADLARCLLDLADDAARLGDRARARGYLLKARSLLEGRTARGHPDVAVALRGLADLAASDGDLDRARALHREAVAVRRRTLGPEHPLLAQALVSYADALLLTGHTADAVDAALEAESIRRGHLRFTQRMLPERQTLRYEARLASGLSTAVAACAGTWDSRMVERVWDAVVRSRAIALDEMASRLRSAAESIESSAPSRMGEAVSLRRQLANLALREPSAEDPEASRLMLDSLRARSERVEEALRDLSPSGRNEPAPAAGLGEVLQALPSNAGLVSLVRYRDRRLRGSAWSYAAFVTRRGSEAKRVVPLGDASELESLVTTWRMAAGRRAASVQETAARDSILLRAGRALRSRVWDPLDSALGGCARAVIVPDGAFHLVNLAALPLEDGRFLVEQGPTFQVVSSERDLLAPARPASGRGFLGFADPDFDAPSADTLVAAVPEPSALASVDTSLSRPSDVVYRGEPPCALSLQSASWTRLPGSAREVERAAELWNAAAPGAREADVMVLRGAEASEAAFKRFAPGRRVLHLATHGFFVGACRDGTNPLRRNENPLLRAGLVLSGANRGVLSRRPPNEGEDGILTADEIAAIDLSDVEAILSGCETGVGAVRAGEGVFGLRRAFEVAGVRTLVMSLWPVPDESAGEWTSRYYEARLRRGLDSAGAAREASRRMLEESRSAGEPPDPFTWAAFIAAGR